jgi:catechol 2,3-dioxygenase-like lactoylglutathione lyase family enzyme
LRIFDEAKAREFYVGFLGFKVDWEHRFEPGLPLYLQVSRDGCVLHLSEHHGDASPGGCLRIEEQPWGRDMSVRDPFGNRLTFTAK